MKIKTMLAKVKAINPTVAAELRAHLVGLGIDMNTPAIVNTTSGSTLISDFECVPTNAGVDASISCDIYKDSFAVEVAAATIKYFEA